MKQKSVSLIIVILLLFPANADARKISVSSASQLKTAIQNLAAGDTIEAADGNYDFGGNISITKSGTAEEPVLIKSKNIHKAVLINTSYFTLKQVSHITIEGFLFLSKDVTAVKTESCNNIRITGNIFRLQETTSNKWVLIGGKWNLTEPNSYNNRIDYNLFEKKHQLGNFITIDGSPDPNAKSSTNDRIDHNHFRNIGPRANNEMEAIRVGWSEMSLSSGYTTIEYNLFENCDGDPEIISVKTCDNTIRYNTFRASQGTVCLRHGNRNTIEGNFFLGDSKEGTGGVRIYGDDHKIYNNYFEGLKGNIWDAAITITNGDADSNSTSLSKHFRPKRAQIVFNTLVNNDYNIEIGYTNNGAYTRPPKDIFIANNIVTGSRNLLIKYYTAPLNLTWSGNIMFPTESAELGITAQPDQINILDPKLVLLNDIWKLDVNSPAINASLNVYPFIVYDADGQSRDSAPDTGADEYSTGEVILRPLTPSDVGPFGGNLVVPVELGSFSWEVSGNKVNINWMTASEKNNLGFQVERGINKDEYSAVGFIKGNGTTTLPVQYSFTEKLLNAGIYYYRLSQIDYDGTISYLKNFYAAVSEPETFLLEQNFPNPFNPLTRIRFSLPGNNNGNVNLQIYDALGNQITTLVKKELPAGRHEIDFNADSVNGTRLPSGVYFYRLVAGNYSQTGKMILSK